MVHYLKITNFGPIKEEVEMNFEVTEELDDSYEVIMPDGKRLLKLAYIYGANASGKTTVLKAFEFLRTLLLRPATDKSVQLDFEPFLFRDQPYNQPSSFEFSFYVEGVRYVYGLSLTKEAILDEKVIFYQTAKPSELYSRTTDLEKRLATIQFGSKLKIPQREKDLLESNTLHNNTVLGAYSKTNVDIPELEKLNRWCSTVLIGLFAGGQNLNDFTTSMVEQDPAARQWINTFLNKADAQVAEIDIGEGYISRSIPMEDYLLFGVASRFQVRKAASPTVTKEGEQNKLTTPTKYYGGGTIERNINFIHHVDGEQRYRLPIGAESSGTKRYYGLGGVLYELIRSARMLCIDELETSLHPDLMTYFLQLFLLNTEGSQLLITTHNLTLIENTDFVRRDALWFTEKNGDGSMNLYSAADFDTLTLRKDASLINAYRSGKLGAKPNLGSPYLTQK